jgi:hypothetical protein
MIWKAGIWLKLGFDIPFRQSAFYHQSQMKPGDKEIGRASQIFT